MPRNGSGTYQSPSGQPVVTGTVIDSTVFNSNTADVATALTNSLAKNGETTPSANLPMGGFKHTGVADASARTQYPSAAQMQDSTLTLIGSITGSDTIAGSPTIAVPAYVTGQAFRFIPGATNTGAATINVSGLGAKAIVKGSTGAALVAGDIVIAKPATIIYDGTSFILQNPTASGTASAAIFSAGDGDAANPSYTFALDTNTGLYRSGTDTLSVTTGGVQRVSFSTATLSTSLPIESTSDHISVANTDVYYELKETDGASNAKTWWLRHTGGNFFLQTRTDVGGAGANAVTITRTGTTVNQIQVGPDGTVGAPALTWENDTNTGFYRSASDVIATTVGGTRGPVFQLNGTIGQLALQDGIAGFPGLAFDLDGDTGVYRLAADTVGFAVGGTRGPFAQRVSSVSALFLQDGTIAQPAMAFDNAGTTGLLRRSSGMGVSVAGALSIDMQGAITSFGDGFTSGDRIRLNNSTARSAANLEHYLAYQPTQLDFYSYDGSVTTGGTARFRHSQLQLADGTVGTPVLSCNADTDTGWYRTGSGTWAFSSDGTQTFSLTTLALGSALVKDTAGNAFSVGFRSVPVSSTTTTLVAADNGKCVPITAAINIPISVFSAGDCVSIYNDSAGALNITISAGTLRLAGTTTTGTRVVAVRGMVTLWFRTGGATPEVVATGNVS